MKPQRIDLNSEVLDEFRDKMNFLLETAVMSLAERKLTKGTISAKLEIVLMDHTNEETGEVNYQLVIKPDVKLKIGASAKMDCREQGGIVMKLDKEGRPMIASNQISFDDLEGEKK